MIKGRGKPGGKGKGGAVPTCTALVPTTPAADAKAQNTRRRSSKTSDSGVLTCILCSKTSEDFNGWGVQKIRFNSTRSRKLVGL